jgi:hypothetical protein
VSDDVRISVVTGLRAISGALDKLAANFTPLEAEEAEEKETKKTTTKKKSTKK